MRQKLKDQEVGMDTYFKYRGKNQTRLETFSDAAFALAITLLVLSSSVPETFTQLRESMQMVLPFAFCVVLITLIWYQHYLFFLKYGLQDANTVAINTFLIFLILVYVFPLKFLSRFLYAIYKPFFTDIRTDFVAEFGSFSHNDQRFLMMIYGIGAGLIFYTLAWLYRYAYSRRHSLELNRYEILDTKVSITKNILQGTIPLLSFIVAWWDPFGNYITVIVSGFTYFLYPPVMIFNGIRAEKKLKALKP